LNVLSFGDEEEEEEVQASGEGARAIRFRSAHEMIDDDARLEKAEVGVHDAHVEELQRRLATEHVRPFPNVAHTVYYLNVISRLPTLYQHVR
jgi:hypothetical protein